VWNIGNGQHDRCNKYLFFISSVDIFARTAGRYNPKDKPFNHQEFIRIMAV